MGGDRPKFCARREGGGHWAWRYTPAGWCVS